MDISKIVYFEADGNYTNIILANKLCGVICMNLAQTEKVLSAQLKERAQIFARIGKSYIINMRYIYQINSIKKRLVLSDYVTFSYQLEVSKEALKKLKDMMTASLVKK
ncbi:MAG: LytTR family DNA-binding domain-containing protein [Rikenellaceae bacterium]